MEAEGLPIVMVYFGRHHNSSWDASFAGRTTDTKTQSGREHLGLSGRPSQIGGVCGWVTVESEGSSWQRSHLVAIFCNAAKEELRADSRRQRTF